MRFSEIIGQNAATDLLRMAFVGQNLSHAYLFSGPRGCGKTTAARLVAKVVNCSSPSPEGEPCCECPSCRAVVSGDHMDVMEIDGASSRGIDQIRELKSHVGLSPFMGGKKVYILDEVHMLTMEAFNALLKTLEEPPSSVLFLFATTEPHKVPVTIRSRCQHIPFHRITTADIVTQLSFIAKSEQVKTEETALWEIARNADGALRDAISLFEQALASGSGEVNGESVKGLFGGAARGELEGWISLLRTDPAEASAMLKNTFDRGVSHERFLESLFPLLKDMWVYSLWGERAFAGLSLSAEERAFLSAETPNWRSETLGRMNRVCASLFPRARFGQRSEVFFGLLLFELLGAMEEPAQALPVRAPARERQPLPPQEREAPPAERKSEPIAQAVPRQPEGGISAETPKVTAPPPEPPQLPDGSLHPFLSLLWNEDISLCAALLDVRVRLDGSKPLFDYSGAIDLAKVVIEAPRARNTLKCALDSFLGAAVDGVESKEDESVAVQASSAKPHASTRMRTAVSDMSLHDLSMYIGADILVERPLTADSSDHTDSVEQSEADV